MNWTPGWIELSTDTGRKVRVYFHHLRDPKGFVDYLDEQLKAADAPVTKAVS